MPVRGTSGDEPVSPSKQVQPSLGAHLECLDCDPDADTAFLATLSGGDASTVTFVVAPLQGYYIPDDASYLRKVENHIKGFLSDDKGAYQALRVPVLVGERACVAIVVSTSAVTGAKYFVQEHMDSSFSVGERALIAFPSLQAYIAHVGQSVEHDLKPYFTMLMSGLPCVSEATLRVYKTYLEKCAFAKRGGLVESMSSLHVKACGVDSMHVSGTVIVKVKVIDAEHLRDLRVTPVPAILRGANAGYYLQTRCGNLKIIEVHGEKAESLTCCGVLHGMPHRRDDCSTYLINKHKTTAIVKKLAPLRAHRAHVAARATKFVYACSELDKLAAVNGYTKCKRFFSSGRCSFQSSAAGCRNFPCNDKYASKIDSVRLILDSLA